MTQSLCGSLLGWKEAKAARVVSAREQGKSDSEEFGDTEQPGHSELRAMLKTLDFIPGKFKTLKRFKHREDMT